MFRNWLAQLRRASSARLSSRQPRPIRPQIESLEDRFMPAVNVLLTGRVLVAQGDNAGNFIQLDNGGSNTALGGVLVPNSKFDSIVINPGNGTNSVLIHGNPKPTSINLGRGTDTINIGDQLNILDMRSSIAVNALLGGVKTLNYNDQVNPTATLTYTLSASGATGRVQRNGLGDLSYTGISNLTVNTGSVGNQTVNVQSTVTSTLTTVRGGRGNDTFTVGDAANRLQTPGQLSIDGGSSQDSLTIRDTGTTAAANYAITSNTVSRSLGSMAPILYNHITTLFVNAGSGGNVVDVDGIASSTRTTISAGNGNNFIIVGNTQLFDVGDLTLIGGLQSDRLLLNDQTASAPHSYSLNGTVLTRDGKASVRYINVENVNFRPGGAFDGSASPTGILTGGGNTITVANLTAVSVSTTLSAGPHDTITVSGFQQAPLTINDPLFTASLVVDEGFLSTPQSYTVTGTALSRPGAAAINYAGLGSVQLITSNAVDTVSLTSTSTSTKVVAGNSTSFRMGNGPFNGALTVNALTGTGKLDYSAYQRPVYVNLQTGEATNLKAFSGIRDVTGGNGNDILVGNGHSNVLAGGSGRNLLIAGGSDRSGQGTTLIGGSDQDILIAGFTTYDRNRAALDAIMVEWSNVARFYVDRVHDLTTGTNGVPLLNATTVFSNQGRNVLVGNTDFDLFFAHPGTDWTDADPEAEVKVAIS